MIEVRRVTVIGAGGTMGAKVAGIFASFGNASVYLVSRDMEKSKAAVEKAVRSVRADSIRRNLIPADDSMLAECVANSDLVFESVSEDVEVKAAVNKRIVGSLRENAVFCTGTSGLSVTAFAERLPENLRKQYLGVHFFNPPYHMTLCEVISTKYTDPVLNAEMQQYLVKTLCRTAVEVKDSPGFLANRIGFRFMNEAMQYAERYGIDYMDAVLGPFTGRAMPPLMTADFVGLDTYKAIADNLYAHTVASARSVFAVPRYVQTLIEAGLLGSKTGSGVYRKQTDEVYEIGTGKYRKKVNYAFPFAERMKAYLKNGDYALAMQVLREDRSQEAIICLQFLLKYILYSLDTAEKLGNTYQAADDVMAAGFGWCPPLALMEMVTAAGDIRQMISAYTDDSFLKEIDADALISKAEPSRYDVRPYFRAG